MSNFWFYFRINGNGSRKTSTEETKNSQIKHKQYLSEINKTVTFISDMWKVWQVQKRKGRKRENNERNVKGN